MTFPSLILTTSNLESGLVASDITTSFTLLLASISFSRTLLSFNNSEDISGETIARTSLVFSLLDSSSSRRRTAVERVFISCVHLSLREDLNLCLDNSKRPNLEILPICTLALSSDKASLMASSTALLFSSFIISMKSMTTKPPISLSLNCLPISSQASMLVFTAVSSMSFPDVAWDELISIATKASASSITIEPPETSFTSL